MSIRKHANESIVHTKTMETAIKQDISPDINPLDYTIWGVLENRTNATPHPNIDSLTAAIEDEWNQMSEEFILMACKSFRRRVDTIIKKKRLPYCREKEYNFLSIYLEGTQIVMKTCSDSKRKK